MNKPIALLHKRSRTQVILAVAATMVALPTIAASQTSQWIGGNSNWNTAANWSPSGVPGSGDTANVTSTLGASQTVTYDYSGSGLTLNTLNLDLTNITSGTPSETLNVAGNTLTAGPFSSR